MDFLLTAAVVPAAILLWYVYKADPVEKEPTGLLARLLGLGALSCIPAIALETFGMNVLMGGQEASTLPQLLLENFIVIALSEELCKFFVLRLKTWRHPAFDYVFDGVVYGVFVSLGFAILENIGYVLEFGMATALVRAFTAIPGHAIFGVFMGCFYGLARREEQLGQHGRKLLYLVAAVAVPVFCHGLYDFAASVDSPAATMLFFGFLIAIMFVAMQLVKHLSRFAHPVHSVPAAVGQQQVFGVYNPTIDNSLDGGAPTYMGTSQYGGGSPTYTDQAVQGYPQQPATGYQQPAEQYYRQPSCADHPLQSTTGYSDLAAPGYPDQAVQGYPQQPQPYPYNTQPSSEWDAQN